MITRRSFLQKLLASMATATVLDPIVRYRRERNAWHLGIQEPHKTTWDLAKKPDESRVIRFTVMPNGAVIFDPDGRYELDETAPPIPNGCTIRRITNHLGE